ncbi:MAG TPA: hypothetical protein VGG39_36580 [Polyangiaceae bacterium]
MFRRLFLSLVPFAFAGAYAFGGCTPIQNQTIGIDGPPYSTDSFKPVADYLGNRCGTLDCHGQAGRNFRVWGCQGLRLEPDASPASCTEQTTEAEYEATYRSLVGLEPQVMSTVYVGCASSVPDGGGVYPPGSSCHPELLTFIRKARGLESHKGGQLICTEAPCPPGVPVPAPIDDAGPPVDPQDVCLVTWLEGQTDQEACQLAEGIPNFPTLDGGP